MELDDLRAFGDFLSRAKARIGKTFDELAAELRINLSQIGIWHRYAALPKRTRLPDIARVYDVPVDELMAAYERTKTARETEKRSRTGSRPHRTMLKNPPNYDLPSSGPVCGRTHYFKAR